MPDLDPDLESHITREEAFASSFAWPPEDGVTDTRPRRLLHPWSIDREAAADSLKLPGSSELEMAVIAFWLVSHEAEDIIRLRIQRFTDQLRAINDFAAAQVLVSERDALKKLMDQMFAAADQNKTLPASGSRGGDSGNAPRP